MSFIFLKKKINKNLNCKENSLAEQFIVITMKIIFDSPMHE